MSEEKMKTFIRELFDIYYPDCGDIDGGELQDLAEKHGILVPEIRHEPCGDSCNCAQICSDEEFREGVKCYSLANWLSTQREGMDCRTALLTLLDQVDYTTGNCRPNEMVGAVLDKRVIQLCREAAQKQLAAETALPVGDCPFCLNNEPHLKEHCYREIRRAAKA